MLCTVKLSEEDTDKTDQTEMESSLSADPEDDLQIPALPVHLGVIEVRFACKPR